MSQENVNLVRSIYADWERGDFSSVAWAHPDIEYVITDGPTPGRWTGHAGLRDGFHHFAGAWDTLHVKATEFTQHLTFRDGKIASSRDFLSHADGLKAAGLSE